MTEATQPKRILILSSATAPYQTELNQTFVDEVNTRLGDAGELIWCNYRDIRFEFETGTMRVYVQSTGASVNEFAFVYFKSYLNFSEEAAAVAAYLDALHIPFACSELRSYLPMTKLSQFTRLALAGIPIAPTVYLSNSLYEANYQYLFDTLGSPFIFKSTYGKGGDQNYLIHSGEELHEALSANPDVPFVAQRFIANDSDLRILIVDRKVELIIERRRAGNSHLNNTSQGAAATLVDPESLPAEHVQLALQAAAVLGREIAGVDLMYETGTGYPVILEVNASPQVASGAFKQEKLDIYSNYFKNVLK